MIDEQDPKLISAPANQKMIASHAQRPMVSICAWCQGINNEGYENFSKGVDPRILKELRIVDFRVKKTSKKGDIGFSHGICDLHNKQMYAGFGKVPFSLPSTAPKCLITDHALRRQYMNGLFTPEQVEMFKKQGKTLRERLQKLANIKKS